MGLIFLMVGILFFGFALWLWQLIRTHIHIYAITKSLSLEQAVKTYSITKFSPSKYLFNGKEFLIHRIPWLGMLNWVMLLLPIGVICFGLILFVDRRIPLSIFILIVVFSILFLILVPLTGALEITGAIHLTNPLKKAIDCIVQLSNRREEKKLDLERKELEIESERLEVEEKAIKASSEVVDILYPGIDKATKEKIVQALLSSLLQLSETEGINFPDLSLRGTDLTKESLEEELNAQKANQEGRKTQLEIEKKRFEVEEVVRRIIKFSGEVTLPKQVYVI
jgi:hypothetical protein